MNNDPTPEQEAASLERAMSGGDNHHFRIAELEEEIARLRKALSDLAGAANAVYIEDDVFTERREGDGREKRDDDLGIAIDRAVAALGE